MSGVAKLRGCEVAKQKGASAAQPRNRATAQPVFVLLVVLALFVAPALHACPVCFGDPNSPMVKATNNGMLFMLAVVGFVQLGFLALFYSFWRRSRALRRRRESFRVVEGGTQ
jgi:hypothetical protein